MVEYDCPICYSKLRIPNAFMGMGGTCKHCGAHFETPPMWRYRLDKVVPTFLWVLNLPFRYLSYLVRINSRPQPKTNEERLLAEVSRATRQQNSCLGCLIILIIVLFVPIWVPLLLALIGLGALGAAP